MPACGSSEAREQERQEQAKFDAFLNTLEEFRTLVLVGRIQAEEMSGLVEDVWSDAKHQNFNLQTLKYVIYLPSGCWSEIDLSIATTSEIVAFVTTQNSDYTYNNYDRALELLAASLSTIEMREGIDAVRRDINAIFSQLRTPPEGLEDVVQKASRLFDYFDTLVSLANNPGRSLNLHLEKRADAINGIAQMHRLLGDLISDARAE